MVYITCEGLGGIAELEPVFNFEVLRSYLNPEIIFSLLSRISRPLFAAYQSKKSLAVISFPSFIYAPLLKQRSYIPIYTQDALFII
jgi:hypothetical protein